MNNAVRTWLIAYDITDHKRLQRVHRYLKSVAFPLQYSVFVAEENVFGIQRIRDNLAEEIDPKTDDVRIYPLPAKLEFVFFGRGALPDGLQVLAERESRRAGLLATAGSKTEAGSEE